MRIRRALLVALPLLLTAIVPLAVASNGYELTGLHEDEGGGWHADNRFVVSWDGNPSISASIVHYAVRGPNHEAVPGADEGSDPNRWAATTVSVPAAPGVYWFEAWNEQWNGKTGPPLSIPLHFDDARPPAISITAPEWVAAGTPIPLRLSHPAPPLSGIIGYAISIDQAAAGSPCARADRCKSAEVDLPGGITNDATTVAAPPEGVSYLHAVAVSGSGMSSPTATREVGVDGTPPQVRLEGAPTGWANGPVHLIAIAADPLSGMAVDGPGGPVTAIGVDGAPPLLTPGATSSTTVSGAGTHQVVYWARDAVGNTGDGSVLFAPAAKETIRIDETDPSVRFAAGDPSDPERIEALVADSQSGPDAGRGSIALRQVGSPARFEPLPTDVDHGRLVARWNSDDYPRGAYEFRATGFDAAGNSATNLAGGGAALVLENPVKRVARLAFGFGGAALVYQRCTRTDGSRRCHRAVIRSFARRPATRAVPCCHGAIVGGRLLDAGGAPLAGQAVDILETFPGGARHPTRITPATTDAKGYFRARLMPGPSRAVSAEFPGTRRLTRAGGRELRLRVRAGVQMRVSTARVRVGGAPVVFSGRILHPEARIPARGLPVELEFRLPGVPWTEFRTVQSDARGRFAYPYSFSDNDSAGVRFLFRAFVPATGGWPFAPATSRPLAVTG